MRRAWYLNIDWTTVAASEAVSPLLERGEIHSSPSGERVVHQTEEERIARNANRSTDIDAPVRSAVTSVQSSAERIPARTMQTRCRGDESFLQGP